MTKNSLLNLYHKNGNIRDENLTHGKFLTYTSVDVKTRTKVGKHVHPHRFSCHKIRYMEVNVRIICLKSAKSFFFLDFLI